MNLILLLVWLCPIFAINIGKNLIEDDWWEYGNFYQVYPRSFKDSDGDGIGDLNGITEKLPYFKELGITGIWLSPIFKSPMVDFGYDISDYYDIHKDYGTLEDFDKLVKKCKELEIRLIIDFVPNHTSDQHEWFQNSKNGIQGYEDFYIWHPGKIDSQSGERIPPNNWLCAFRGSAWEWNEQRQKYYLHQFAIQQPDLNYRNPMVRERIKEVLEFWLKRGVSGFRVDAVTSLIEIEPDANGIYPDEPLSNSCSDPEAACYLNHIYTQNRDETFDLVYEWRSFLDQYKSNHGGETRVMMTEVYAEIDKYMKYYGDDDHKGSQIPFNFIFLYQTNATSNAKDFKRLSDLWLTNMPSGNQANWVIGNHDQKRISTRYGYQKIDLINILLNTLPGIAVTYYGEEIGMRDVFISWEDTVDIGACNTNPDVYNEVSRDPARTPFQWDYTKNAGFSTADKTWLPVSENSINLNAKEQISASRSHLQVFQKLTKLRKQKSLRQGVYIANIIDDDIFTYIRQADGHNPYVVVLNFGKFNKDINLKELYTDLPQYLKVETSSIHSMYREGDIVSSDMVYAAAEVGTVFTSGGKQFNQNWWTLSFFISAILYFN